MEYPSLSTPPAGSIRFNTDSSKMEIYNGDKWWEIDSTSPNEQTGGTRAVCAYGYIAASPNYTDTIDYFNVSTTGNATDFGNMPQAAAQISGAFASSTRGVYAGWDNPSSPNATNAIDYITISSTGNSTDFGDLTAAMKCMAAASNSTRGIWAGGMSPGEVNTIQYVTIASTGNANDFGDTTVARQQSGASWSSTRAVFGGGHTPSYQNIIDYVTIASTGNAADFGDMIILVTSTCGTSNAVRGLINVGGNTPGVNTKDVSYITMASLGNALDFGDLTSITSTPSAVASPTRVCMAGGYDHPLSPGRTDRIEYAQIMSTGNFSDFGNLSVGRSQAGAVSNGHGGLGGGT